MEPETPLKDGDPAQTYIVELRVDVVAAIMCGSPFVIAGDFGISKVCFRRWLPDVDVDVDVCVGLASPRSEASEAERPTARARGAAPSRGVSGADEPARRTINSPLRR